MNINYRNVTNTDRNYLYSLDLKCFETPPEDQKWWSARADNPEAKILLACSYQVPVGFIVWERQAFRLPDFKAKVTSMHIHKICVRESHRGKGIGPKLLSFCHEAAQKKVCPYMSISVPEFMCAPEGKASEWLTKLGFKSTIILPVKIKMYGKHFDEYLFVFNVKI